MMFSTGERREVIVMFGGIRDFTPLAEANTAEDAVANSLFEIVVPVVVDAGWHVGLRMTVRSRLRVEKFRLDHAVDTVQERFLDAYIFADHVGSHTGVA